MPIRAIGIVGAGTMGQGDAFGLQIDATRNQAATAMEAEISPDGSKSRVFMVPNDEELLIARNTYRIVAGRPTA